MGDITRIKINGLDWEVKIVPNSVIEGQTGSKNWGCTNNMSQTIYLDERMPNQLLERVLTHELTHAILTSFSQSEETYTEEDICCLFEAHHHTIEKLLKEIF